MKKNCEGFLLSEALLAMFIVTVGILFMLDSLIFLREQTKRQQDMLELAIFASEIVKFDLSETNEAVQEKCELFGIKIIESGDGQLILEKQNVILDLSRK
ncbi:hypothetical protein [Vagococcus jeotgali]|uniref:hypothetical protein n=1 Tax=Vagococcus jeotgali TaxID=3109030 RepID=UPI002DD82686|nr:hypothetical protein [Vagococcus sp. B2T-5]